ncbi:MAG TPA: PmoA family protein [Verrucomicrobiota bacterium]|nr:PmoA family protein [Verrucomicrobiota bacterium]HNT13541.1 PmoA family protein [Verrucomicrobiota bacterium]
MRRRWLIWFVCGGLSHPLLAADRLRKPVVAPLRQVLNMAKGELQWEYRGKPLLVYAFADNQFKPYVRELYTLRGENVLRDAPADHLHHHGLMYAVQVNGINFWEEGDEPGIEKSIRLVPGRMGRNAAGRPEAAFTQTIHWVAFPHRKTADSAAVALLIENRTLTLTVDAAAGEVALVWEARFELGPNTPRVRLHGANYNGLGLRLPESLDQVARFVNSAGTAFAADHPPSVTPARWTGVSGTVAGQDIALALFARDENANGRARFFTMTRPFAYLAATQGLDGKPLEYRNGERFGVRYLLTVYAENKSRAFMAQRAAQWSDE